MSRRLLQADISRAAGALMRKVQTLPLHEMGASIPIWGVPRGGVPAAMALSKVYPRFHVVDELTPSVYFVVDDLVDSGETRSRILSGGRVGEGTKFASLFTKRPMRDSGLGYDLYGEALAADEWVTFPWEGDEAGSATDIPTRLLQYIGEDPARGGLLETPARFLKAWKELTSGYGQDPKEILKSFEDGVCDEMVVVRDIKFYSQCEHHMLPFFGVAHVGYVPSGKIVGLSKIPRLVDVFAHRLQVQERMGQQIANAINEVLEPKGVAVVLEARHLCMESRGIRREGSRTVTAALLGVLKEKGAARAEFYSIINR